MTPPIWRANHGGAVPTHRRAMLPYVVGNGGALVVGMLICYAAVMRGGMGARGWDFFYYYSTSRLVLGGHAGSIYDPYALGKMQSSLAYPYVVPHGSMPDLSPALLSVLLAPLSALPYELAYVLWMVTGCFILAFSLFKLEQYAGLARVPSFWLRLAAMISLPVLIALVQGQTTMLTLGLLTSSLHFLRQGKDGLAGALLALAMIKPQYAIAFVVIFVARRRWRVLLAMAATAILLLIAPMPILGPGINGAYFHTLLQATSWGNDVGGFSPVGNRSIAGQAQLLLPVHAAAVVTYLCDILAAALLGIFALRSPRGEAVFALAVVATLLISPHVLIHDLSLILIPVAIVLQRRTTPDYALLGLLVACYAAINVGVFVSMVAPFQLSVPALIALGLCIVFVERRGHGSFEVGTFSLQPRHGDGRAADASAAT